MEKKDQNKVYLLTVGKAAFISFLFLIPLFIKFFTPGYVPIKPWKNSLMPYGCPYLVGQSRAFVFLFFFFALYWIFWYCAVIFLLFYRKRHDVQILKSVYFSGLGLITFPVFFFAIFLLLDSILRSFCIK